MSFTNWLVNVLILLISGLIVGFFLRNFSSKFKLTLASVLGVYTSYYIIGYLFHTNELNAFTFHFHSPSITSLIGVVLLTVTSLLVVYTIQTVKRTIDKRNN